MDKMTDEMFLIGKIRERLNACGNQSADIVTAGYFLDDLEGIISRVQPIDPRVIEEAIEALEFSMRRISYLSAGQERDWKHDEAVVYPRIKEAVAKLKSVRQPKTNEADDG